MRLSKTRSLLLSPAGPKSEKRILQQFELLEGAPALVRHGRKIGFRWAGRKVTLMAAPLTTSRFDERLLYSRDEDDSNFSFLRRRVRLYVMTSV